MHPSLDFIIQNRGVAGTEKPGNFQRADFDVQMQMSLCRQTYLFFFKLFVSVLGQDCLNFWIFQHPGCGGCMFFGPLGKVKVYASQPPQSLFHSSALMRLGE